MDTFLITEDDGPTVVVTPESAGELLASGVQLIITETEPGSSLVSVEESAGGGHLIVTENQPSITDATSIEVVVSEGGVTGPGGHSIDVTWSTTAPGPGDEETGDEGDLWVVL